ncbi:MAG: GNAT family N-acetyltransferase [Bacillaceae bacterium]|nr:GNAT family N-acetyltransferase [Bacillaceae bacterium]
MNLAQDTFVIKKVARPEEKKDAFHVRYRVFVEEQKVPEELELDQYDEQPETIHFVAYNQKMKPVGAARLREWDTRTGKVERVAVLSYVRENGLGSKIMNYLEQEARKKGYRTLKLNAQLQAQKFYARLGYEPYGKTFMDAGIEHIAMKKNL